MFASVAVQAVSGLFSSDDIVTEGPLVAHVSDATVACMTSVHVWNEKILLILIGLHIGAVLWHRFLMHDDLIMPMFTGRKQVTDARPLRFASVWLALGLLVACAALVAALVWWAG
jgi:cytochrome b